MKAKLSVPFFMILMISLNVLEAKEAPGFLFKDWKKSIKINHDTIQSDAHNAFLDIYVNELAKDAYLEEKKLFPLGSIVYKPLYNDPYRKEFARLVIMVKMRKGYDPKNGDWWYGVYDPSGTQMYYQGKIRSCIVCHEQGKETDYMFPKSVNKKIEKMLFNSKRSWKKKRD